VIPGKSYTPELIVQIAWRRKWWIVLPAIVVAAGVAAWTHELPNVFKSDTLIMIVPQRVPESYVRSTVTQSIGDRLQAITQQILSRTRLEKIIEDLNLYPAERKTMIMEDIVEGMRRDIDVQLVKGDSFRVGFQSEDPRTAMRVAERLASLFIDESLRDREVLAEGTNQFLEAQLEDARRQLIDNEKKLEEYRRSHDGQLPTQLEANMQGIHNTEMQVQALVDSINRDRDRHLVLERAIADADEAEVLTSPPPPPVATPSPGGPALQTPAQQLAAARAELQDLELRLKPGHPDVVRARKHVAELQAAVDRDASAQPVSGDVAAVPPAELARRNRLAEMKGELDSLDKQIAYKTDKEQQLRANLEVYQHRIEATPTRESELADLTRDYGTLQTSYRNLLAKKQDSQISANLERRQIGEQFRVLDAARLPSRPDSPNRPRFYGLGVLGGFGIGLAIVVLFEYLDRTMKSESDVRAALNATVLATIPLIQVQRRSLALKAAVFAAVATGVLGIVAAGIRYLR
jgi:polysaccharide chain length determinant protein (PEP-CTERM system associated)